MAEFRVRLIDNKFAGKWTVANGPSFTNTTEYINKDGIVNKICRVFHCESEAQAALDLYLEKQKPIKITNTLIQEQKLLPVSHKDYMFLSDAYDKHSRDLMGLKGEEYSIDGDFLAMENRLAGMLGDSSEYVSLVMAGKHITALGIILLKNDVTKIKLEKLDERIRDAVNLLKITAAFIHAKQGDFSLHLGKEEKQKEEENYNAAIDHETGAETPFDYVVRKMSNA